MLYMTSDKNIFHLEMLLYFKLGVDFACKLTLHNMRCTFTAKVDISLFA